MKKTFTIISLFLTCNAFATIIVNPTKSEQIWKSVDIISKIENLDIIQNDGNQKFFIIENLACVFENYYACSFFTKINSERKMIVTLDGSEKFIRSLVSAGIKVDEDNARIDVDAVMCEVNSGTFSCELEEYVH